MARKTKKDKPLAVLAEEDRFEYAMRHNLLLQKQLELSALNQVQEAFLESLIIKYGLPNKFDVTLATGEIFKRPEGEDHAQNGRV